MKFKEDSEYLEWLYSRMINTYKEDQGLEFMREFWTVIDSVKRREHFLEQAKNLIKTLIY